MAGEDVLECPICDTEVEEGSTECLICGEKFVEEKNQEEIIDELTKITVIDERGAKKLYDKGIKNYEDVLENGITGLIEIQGIGIETAMDILEETKQLQEEKEQKCEEKMIATITSDLEELTSFSDEGSEDGDILEDLLRERESSSSDKRSKVTEIEDRSKKEVFTDEGIVKGFLNTIDIKDVLGSEEKDEDRIKANREGKKHKDIQQEMPKLRIENTGLYREISKAIPIITALFIPTLLLIYVGLEFIIALLAYPSIYPARSLYYLTPSPFLQPSWISSLTLSFLVTVGLFLPTWKGYELSSSSNLKLDKYFLAISVVFSLIIVISLSLHIYYSLPDPVALLTFVLLFLTLFLLVAQLDVLLRADNSYPKKRIKKLCPGCGESMPLVSENCPQCGLNVAVPDEDNVHEKVKDVKMDDHDQDDKIRVKEGPREDLNEDNAVTEEGTTQKKEALHEDDEIGLVEDQLGEDEEETILEEEEII